MTMRLLHRGRRPQLHIARTLPVGGELFPQRALLGEQPSPGPPSMQRRSSAMIGRAFSAITSARLSGNWRNSSGRRIGISSE
jgi:hypothetical protein